MAHGRIRAAADTFAGIGNRELSTLGRLRQFAKTLAPDAAQHRVWVDAEWGLRYYLESEGALPLARDQAVQPGDTIVSSELAQPVTVNAPVAQVSAANIVLRVPLRLISLSRRSAYSSAAGGLLPFEISSAPADRVRADTVVDRKPVLSYSIRAIPRPAHIFSRACFRMDG